MSGQLTTIVGMVPAGALEAKPANAAAGRCANRLPFIFVDDDVDDDRAVCELCLSH